MIFKEKVFVESMILNQFFCLVRFWINFFSSCQTLIQLFSSCQILNQPFFVWSDFDSTFPQRVRIGNKNFTTRQILNRNNLPKSTTCTFHIAFLHITINSYNPRHLRHLDNGIRHHSSKTFCTLFRKDFHFWFRYGVPLFCLNLLDICKTRCC